VTITAPSPNQEVVEGRVLEVRLEVSDDVRVASVRVSMGDTVATVPLPSPSPVVRLTVPNGTGPVAITAIVTDLGGVTGSDSVVVTVVPDPAPGSVLFLPFNGNANDESGTGNDGIVFGATLSEAAVGNPNRAFFFDPGVSDYLDISRDICGR